MAAKQGDSTKKKEEPSFHNTLDALFQKLSKDKAVPESEKINPRFPNPQKETDSNKNTGKGVNANSSTSNPIRSEKPLPATSQKTPDAKQPTPVKMRYPSVEKKTYLNSPILKNLNKRKDPSIGNAVVSLADAFAQVQIPVPKPIQLPTPPTPKPTQAKVTLPRTERNTSSLPRPILSAKEPPSSPTQPVVTQPKTKQRIEEKKRSPQSEQRTQQPSSPSEIEHSRIRQNSPHQNQAPSTQKAPFVKRISLKKPGSPTSNGPSNVGTESTSASSKQVPKPFPKQAQEENTQKHPKHKRRPAPWLDKDRPYPHALIHKEGERKNIHRSSPLHLHYPELPICQYKDDIIQAISDHQVVIVVGETGSGKTTQLAKMAYDAAQQGKLGKEAKKGHTRIGCTQPRRLAAVSVARRVAEEMKEELGTGVGYQVRFDERVTSETALKFMTDGILLAETQGDPLLKEYHTLIIDEAHERSLNIDFILGFLKLLLEKRPDLKLIISSATMDVETFSTFFNEAPVIFVEGRTFPVEMHYLPERENEELPRHIDRAVEWLTGLDNKGDVLIFLPGEREIRDARDVLEGRRYPHTEVLPLFARMSLGEQQKIFQPQKNKRRIILATNVAETSLTIPGIIYVVDSGVVRMSRYSPGRQVQRLMIEPTSQASARQRAGRCGRITEGVCVRLYSEDDFNDRKEFTDPEMKRSSLASVLLRMKALGLPEMSDFPLPDPPSQKLVSEGYRVLRELGALTRNKELTPLGYYLAKLPVDPQLGRMILEAKERRCLSEIVVLAAGLSIMDVRERPADKTTQADQAQKRWKNEQSDFLSLLSLWSDLISFKEGKNWKRNALRKFCNEHYLNFLRVIEWSNLVDDLTKLLQESLNWKLRPIAQEEKDRASYADLHKSILSGIPRQFGYWNPEEKEYRGAQGRSFAVFPGSSLFGRKKRPEWIMGVEIVETTRLWMRRCAEFDPAWVEEVAPHLCESRYYHAEWDPVQGAVYAKERVMCGGLTIVDERRMHFGRLFPTEAREIFIRDGLLKDGLKTKPSFLNHLEDLKQKVKDAEVKWRKPEQLWCEDAVVRWLERIIPEDCYTAKAFYQWSSKLKGPLQDALHIPVEEATYALWRDFIETDYPDTLTINGTELSVYYENDPLADDDGATLGAHIDQIDDIPDELLLWGIPGHWALRAELLMRGLPTPLRNSLRPMEEHAQRFASIWKSPEKSAERFSKKISFTQALLAYITETTGQTCYEDQLEHHRIPKELIPKLWVCDDKHRELAFGSDMPTLREKLAPLQKKRFERQAADHWSATGMKSWECDELPYSVELPSGIGYPALVDEGHSVGMKIFYKEQEALHSHRLGCIRLALLNHTDQINHLRKHIPLHINAKLALTVLGKAPQFHTEELIHLCVEGGLGKSLPRSAKAFSEAGYHLKQQLFPAAQIVCKAWEKLVALDVALKKEIPQYTTNKFALAIARDLEIQRDWIFRPHTLLTTGYYRLPDVLRYIDGIYARLQKIPLQPLAKELERLDRLNPILTPWLTALNEAITASSSNTNAQPSRNTNNGHPFLSPHLEALIDYGFLLDEYRLSLFSPGVPVKGKISEKKLAESWESLT